jgi:hypothetical protein
MTSIYKAWMMNYRPSWYELSKPSQDELMGKVGESLAKVGGKLVLVAASLWADEQWAAWGIEEYPNIEAVIQHAQTIADFRWYRFVKSWSILGTPPDPETKVIIPKGQIYKLAFINATEAGYALSNTDMAKWNEKHVEFGKQFGMQVLLQCAANWCNEEWLTWLVEAYPSLEAVQGLRLKTYETGWYQYVSATSLLGTEYQPG